MDIFDSFHFYFIGGSNFGSCCMLTKKVKEWHWKSFSLVSGLFSRFFISTSLAFYFTAPLFDGIIQKISSLGQRGHNLCKLEPGTLSNMNKTLMLSTNNNELKLIIFKCK